MSENTLDDISATAIHYAGVNALRLEWPVGHTIQYGVSVGFENESKFNELKYTVKITRLAPGEQGEPLFQLERIGDVFINDYLPDLIADRLAYTAGKVFYPLVLVLDGNGGFVSVYNHRSILNRWEDVKQQIENEFEGEMVDNYLDLMGALLESPEHTQIAFLNNDWFINTFFKPLYKKYNVDQHIETLYKFPLPQDFRIDGYLIKERLNGQTNDFGGIELYHHGELLPIAEDFLDFSPKGNYNCTYLLHPKYKHIVSATADLQYCDTREVNVKVRISIIPPDGVSFDHDFQVHNRENQLPISDMKIIDGPSRTGFWQNLFK